MLDKLEFEVVIAMWFFWFMLICDLLIPAIMIIAGIIMRKHCPKHINGFLGYRTTRSMKDMDTWRFAHNYCGQLWWKIGCIIFVPSTLIHIPFYHSNENMIGIVSIVLMMIQCIVLVASFFSTEAALKKHLMMMVLANKFQFVEQNERWMPR